MKNELVKAAIDNLEALKLLTDKAEYEAALREVLAEAVSDVYITACAYDGDLEIGEVHFSEKDAIKHAAPGDKVAYLSWTGEGGVLCR